MISLYKLRKKQKINNEKIRKKLISQKPTKGFLELNFPTYNTNLRRLFWSQILSPCPINSLTTTTNLASVVFIALSLDEMNHIYWHDFSKWYFRYEFFIFCWTSFKYINQSWMPGSGTWHIQECNTCWISP